MTEEQPQYAKCKRCRRLIRITKPGQEYGRTCAQKVALNAKLDTRWVRYEGGDTIEGRVSA